MLLINQNTFARDRIARSKVRAFMIQVIYRYLEVLDTLYDEIIMDVNREDFTVGEKYKAKQEELGKELASFHLLSLV